MRRLATVLLLTLSCALATAQFPYVIESFHTDVQMREDATITVTETIKVLFNEPRRGIFRTIPIVYPAGEGSRRAIQLRLGLVVDEAGNRHQTKVTREGDYLNVRIGNPDVTHPPGTRVTYIIQYSAFGALNWHDDGSWQPWTELYWNATGHEWDTEIRNATFRVTFPKQASPKDVRARAFAGAYGDRASVELLEASSKASDGEPYIDLALTESELVGTRTEPLGPYTGVTFVVGVPQAAIPRPPAYVEFLKRLTEYLPLFTPFIVLAIMGWAWSKLGKDPADGPTQVRFEPPSALPAAEAGTMLDERVDQRDLAAGIMSLCVNGYMTVEATEEGTFFKHKGYVLHPTEKEPKPGDLSLFESRLLNYIKKGGESVTSKELREEVAPHMPYLKATIYEDLVDRSLYQANPNTVRGTAIFLGIALSAGVTFLLSLVSLNVDVWVPILGGALGILPAVHYGWQMPLRTRYGAQVRRETLGFYEMMRHRENYMKWVVEKQPDGLKYEEYLPYAVAFDLIEQWNDAFRDIVHEPPRWYHDPYGGPFYPHLFASDLRGMTSSLASAASTPPRSSGASGRSSGFSFGGGGGGGFSGGGFGGGGGGSW